jgi:hypothetical protein
MVESASTSARSLTELSTLVLFMASTMSSILYLMESIYHAYYNFCRVHQRLRVTAAMEAGLTDHVWCLDELVGLLGQKELGAAA